MGARGLVSITFLAPALFLRFETSNTIFVCLVDIYTAGIDEYTPCVRDEDTNGSNVENDALSGCQRPRLEMSE